MHLENPLRNVFSLFLELDLSNGQNNGQNELDYNYGGMGNGNGQGNGDPNYNNYEAPNYYGGDAGTELEYNCYR